MSLEEAYKLAQKPELKNNGKKIKKTLTVPIFICSFLLERLSSVSPKLMAGSGVKPSCNGL